jgi:hypothetical protein
MENLGVNDDQDFIDQQKKIRQSNFKDAYD